MKILLILLLAFPVYSQVKVNYDKFKDQTIATTDTYLSKGVQMYVKAVHPGTKAENVQYFLVFRSSSREWRWLNNHGLIFLVDGERMDLGRGAHDGDIHSSRYRVGVSETVIYKIQRDELEKLVSPSVEMKLGQTEIVFGENDKKAVKEMLEYK